MKKPVKLMAMIGALSLVTLFAAGCSNHYNRNGYYDPHHGSHGYSNGYKDPYRIGYDRGFEHGYADRRSHYSFNYEHSDVFRHGISSNSYANDRFRDGYARGYRDGYYR